MNESTKKSTKSAAPAAVAPQHPLRAILRAAVPLAAFETSDPVATIEGCKKTLGEKFEAYTVIQWDLVRGLAGLNKKGAAWISSVLDGREPSTVTNPSEALEILGRVGNDSKRAPLVSEDTICFFHNAQRLITEPSVIQGFWNLRDTWKQVGAVAILLCPAIRLPDELVQDVVVISEPLPDSAQMAGIVDSVLEAAGFTADKTDKIKDKAKITDTLLGLSAFAAEQALAMSLSKELGVNQKELWNRKRKLVEQTPGLSVWQGGETFADIGGLTNIKNYLTSILSSARNPVRCIGFIDEIEKLFAGASGGDLSGVSADQLKVFLTEMQDQSIPGIILIGPPGTGKSAIAKGAGAVASAEVLSIDTGAMTGSLVGESQAKIRKAMQTFSAVSQGKGLFIATCNQIAALPPELRRRFTLGTFYVDLPSAEERESIWNVWFKRYESQGLENAGERPNDEGWTGAEIKACCDVAWRANIPLKAAAQFIVPVAKSAADKIQALRNMASGKFISASYEGIYDVNRVADATPEKKATRRVNLDN